MNNLRSRAKEALRFISERDSRRREVEYLAATSHLDGAPVFDGLTPTSLSLASSQPKASAPLSVNLVLPELSERAMFAGIRTAIEFGAGASNLTHLPLNIIFLNGVLGSNGESRLRELIERDFALAGTEVSFVGGRQLSVFEFNPDALWIATHWRTAHALDVACSLGVVDARKVFYLVQDYEPGFVPWSTDYALARATYHAGFTTISNSSPVARYLLEFEGIVVPDSLIFRPSLDIARLERAAARRTPSDGSPSVTFYGRPNKPRNMFALGMAALQAAAAELRAQQIDVKFSSFGDAHPVPSRGFLKAMDVKGKLSWDSYFDALSQTNVVLSLQMSPHPSHPPLDAVVSGGIAVTNELNGMRGDLHPRLLAAEAHPAALAAAVVAAVTASPVDVERHDTDGGFLSKLGRPLSATIESAVNLAFLA